MTDKEQITMNETSPGSEQQRTCETCNMTAQGGYLNCEYTCAYKVKKLKDDLVCKTQECEGLRTKLDYYIKKTEQLLDDIDNKDRFNSELQQECEELKKQLDTSEKWRIKAEGLNEKLELKNTRYRKALEEIERIATTFRARESSYHNVLDIISKAKGEE